MHQNLIKRDLVVRLGESVATIVWTQLSARGHLERLDAEQRMLDEAAGSPDRDALMRQLHEVAVASTDQVLEDQKRLGLITGCSQEMVESLNADNPRGKSALTISRELPKALRRLPTRRSAIYELFLNFHSDRSQSCNLCL